MRTELADAGRISNLSATLRNAGDLEKRHRKGSNSRLAKNISRNVEELKDWAASN